MKLALALSSLAALSGVSAHGHLDLRREPHLWTFGTNGVNVFTADGSEMVSSVPMERACHNTGTVDDPNYRCFFTDVVSDGKKYVWAAVSRGEDKISVYSIQTGALVGSFSSCGGPRYLDYQELREEIWVHCSDFSAMEESHLDVFSAVSPAAPITTRVLMHNNTAARSFGKIKVDETLGDVGFATVYGQKYLYKIDLSQRMVMDQIMVGDDNPKLNGLYEMSYSPVNQHLFLRTQVCCTCGFVGADNLECGRYGYSNVTIGNIEYEGQCGRHCVGTAADTIGVYEFDTINNTVVGTHQFDGSSAVDTPVTSPDGQHVVFFGLNGGKTIRILTVGANGEKSTDYTTLELDGFNSSISEEISAYDDFAWIQNDDMNLFVVASSTDFKVAVVDLSDMSNPQYDYITLSDMTLPADARLRDRQVEWVEGTDYVWISGRVEKQIYVVNIRTRELVNTFTDVEAYKLVSVVNNEFTELAEQLQATWEENGAFDSRSQENMMPESSNVESSSTPESSTTESSSTASSTTAQAQAANNDNGDGSNATLSIVAIALSVVAILAVMTNFFMSQQKQAEVEKISGEKSQVPPSVA